MKTSSPLCLSCSRVINGRADKKFCNLYCRNNYHNKKRAGLTSDPILSITEAILRNNRLILSSLLSPGQPSVIVPMTILEMKGFRFHFHTQTLQAANGEKYFGCYEYGYRELERQRYLIVADLQSILH